MKDVKIAVLSHIYYQKMTELTALKNGTAGVSIDYLFNICLESLSCDKIKKELASEFEASPVIITSNKGKDIGGKLALIDLSMRLNTGPDFYVFLHDKQSPHTSLGMNWREKLFRIIQPEFLPKIAQLFQKDKKIGIVCAKEFIMNEFDARVRQFSGTNNSILKELIKEYAVHPENYDFVGGTMFWIRSEIVHHFFAKHSPLKIRASLEKGNILDYSHGSITHGWERMLSWIAADQGYYIKGI